ncbi:hypothetical protein [Stenotrophomonas sp. NPDC078853]|uniref:hypothetical protein n=1 Tax=Stenotrophomonas sp. NPDC078853 TaxID=3364534 RepID=UPI00384A67A7
MTDFEIDKYLDVVWVAGGRAFPELDCYGVVQEVRRDLGLEPWPEYAGATRVELPDLAVAAAAERPGSDLADGAVAFCYEGSMVTHVAVLVTIDGRQCALECSEAHNVTVLPLGRFERRYTSVEYYG